MTDRCRWNDGQLDPTIRKLVEVLNEYGLETISSCAGHVFRDEQGAVRSHPGHITFKAARKVTAHVEFHNCEDCEEPDITLEWYLPKHLQGEDRS